MEPEKCDGIGWFALNKLPSPLSKITQADLKEYRKRTIGMEKYNENDSKTGRPEIDFESPLWHQGYLDGWDNKPYEHPQDVTYCDGHETGAAEREGGVNRDGSLPWADNI